MVVALTARMWSDLVTVTETGKPIAALEVALGVDFRDEGRRFEHRVVLAGLMYGWFAARELRDVSAALDRTRIQWSSGRSLGALVESLKTDMPDLVGTVEEQGIGEIVATKTPLRFSRGPRQAPMPSPLLGQHTAELLRNLLGLDDASVLDLAKHNVPATWPGGGPITVITISLAPSEATVIQSIRHTPSQIR